MTQNSDSKNNPQNTIPATYDKKDIEILHKETLYHGFFDLVRYSFRHRLFNGGMSGTIEREVMVRGQAVVLLPYDPRRDEVVLIEQVRIGALSSARSPWLLEVVAGLTEPGEAEEAVARREAQEEAGLTVGRCQRVLQYFASPGGVDEQLTVFVGEVDATQAQGIHGLAEEGEDIRVHVVTRERACQLLDEGQIENAASIIALQWLALHHERLRQAWR